MSIQAMNYVRALQVGRSSEKFILMCFANYADEQGIAYPSQKRLCEDAEMDRKTVIVGIASLERAGYLKDTGRRTGATGQVVIYQILGIPECSTTHYTYKVICHESGQYYIGKRSYNGDPQADVYRGSCAWVRQKIANGAVLVREVLRTYPTSAEALAAEVELIRAADNDSLCINEQTPSRLRVKVFTAMAKRTENGTVPFFQPNSTVFSTKGSQKRDTEPSLNLQENHQIDSAKISVQKKKTELPEWVPLEQWNAYLEMRKKIRAPLTDRAKTLEIAKLEKLRADGHDPGTVLDQSVVKSWRGLFPVRDDRQNNNQTVAFEQTTPQGWVGRLEVFYGLNGSQAGSWSPKWRQKPDETGNCIPQEAWRLFEAKHPGTRRAG